MFLFAQERVIHLNQLQLLWQLQKIDDDTKSLEEKLLNLQSVAEYNSKRKEVNSLVQKKKNIEERNMQQNKELKKEEINLQKISADLQEISNKLYSGEVTNVKELEQMEKKVSLLKKEQSRKEEYVLGIMEDVEKEEKNLELLAEELGQQQLTLKKLKEQAQKEIAQLKASLEQRKREREELTKKIQEPFLKRYQILKEKNKGKVVACVVNGICEGCKVSVPSAFRAHILNEEMVYCENCGRILVLLEG